MKQVLDSCSIECIGAQIISRKIYRSSFMEIKSIGKCTTYKCKLNSEAEIIKELQNPKKPIHKEASMIDLGDMLECESLFFAVNTFRTLKIGLINHTGRHKAQITKTDIYTFAEITRQMPNIPIPKLLSHPVPSGRLG